MIRLEHLSKYYHNNGITTLGLSDINLSFSKGEIVAITGESGSGKSTLLNVIGGMDNYDDGELYFKGNETSFFSDEDLDAFRKKYVAFIFQNYNIIDSYTVLENVMLPMLINGIKYNEAKERALAIIKKVGLEKRIKNRGSKLSGGEKQRVAIARALASDATILACDEPTGNLDSKTGKEIIELIKEVATDKLVLIVTHNYDEVKDIVTRKIKLADGEVVEDVSLKEVVEDENEELNLEYAPASSKIINFLTLFNMKSKPKITILISFILLMVSLIVITLFGIISFSASGSQYKYDTSSNYVMDEYYLVYAKDHKLFSKADFNHLDNVLFNPFVENKAFSGRYFAGGDSESFSVKITDMDIKCSDFKGRIGKLKEDEVIMVFPESYKTTLEYYNKKGAMFSFEDITGNYKVVGIALSKYITSTTLKMNSNIFNKIASAYYPDVTTEDGSAVIKSPDIKKPQLVVSSRFREYRPYLTIDRVSYLPDYDVIIDDTLKGVKVTLPEKFADLFEDKVYEARIYTNNYKDIEKLQDLGYEVYHPYDYISLQEGYVMTLVFVILMAFIPIIFIYIITYVILGIIYNSQSKNYLTLRILGLTIKDLPRMIKTEILSLVSLTTLIVLIITLILDLGLKVSIYSSMLVGFYLLFAFIMPVIALLLGIKISHKLFKASSTKLLSEVNYK